MSFTIDTLAPEAIGENVFRGFAPAIFGGTHLYGGCVVAQSLLAAYATVEERACHSLHAYFIHPGDTRLPITFEVDRDRDGGSFTTRRVTALQNERPILIFMSSFQTTAEGLAHQHPMPEFARSPDELSNDDPRGQSMGIEIRSMEVPRPGMIARVRPPRHQVWARSREPLGALKYHQAALAYTSDFPMLPTMAQPHGITWDMPGLHRASLDHAIWFHRPFDFNGWHLFDLDSPVVANTRGFARATVFGQDGSLVASVTQEAMIRVPAPVTP